MMASPPPSPTVGLRMRKRYYYPHQHYNVGVGSSRSLKKIRRSALSLDCVKMTLQQEKNNNSSNCASSSIVPSSGTAASLYSCSDYIKRRRLSLLASLSSANIDDYKANEEKEEGNVADVEKEAETAKAKAKANEPEPEPAAYFHQQDGEDEELLYVDRACRHKMCEWSYTLCDYYHIDRTIVGVSFSFVDRFLNKYTYCNRNTFKLVAMTTLYVANKLYGCDTYSHHSKDDTGMDGYNTPSSSYSSSPYDSHNNNNATTNNNRLTIENLASLSRGEFDTKHIIDMEVLVLKTLEWKLHPPTTQYLIHTFYDNYNYYKARCDNADADANDADVDHQHPRGDRQRQHHLIYERAMFFGELAVYEYNLITEDRSLLAIASLMNAMEGTATDTSQQQQQQSSCTMIQHFLDYINTTFGMLLNLNLNCDNDNEGRAVDDSRRVNTVRTRLWSLYDKSAQCTDDRHYYCCYKNNNHLVSSSSSTTSSMQGPESNSKSNTEQQDQYSNNKLVLAPLTQQEEAYSSSSKTEKLPPSKSSSSAAAAASSSSSSSSSSPVSVIPPGSVSLTVATAISSSLVVRDDEPDTRQQQQCSIHTAQSY